MKKSSPKKIRPLRDVSQKTRFEVFKRDSFTCQYCGGKAPDIILHLDHIEPIAEGGSNDITNLITSCQPCNSGKGKRRISDNSVVDKSRKEMELIQERRNQLEMMMQWRNGLTELEEQQIEAVRSVWGSLTGFTLSPTGMAKIKDLIKKFTTIEVMDAIEIACKKYTQYKDKHSAETAFEKIGGICAMRRIEKENPNRGMAMHLQNIAKLKVNIYPRQIKEVRTMFEELLESGKFTFDELKNIIYKASTLDSLKRDLGVS